MIHFKRLFQTFNIRKAKGKQKRPKKNNKGQRTTKAKKEQQRPELQNS